jgi:gas vesicle protein
MHNKKNVGKTLGMFLFGAIVGAVSGILMAPKSGKETRKDIQKGVKQVQKKAEKEIHGVEQKAKKAFTKAKQEGTKELEKAQDKWTKIQKDLKG